MSNLFTQHTNKVAITVLYEGMPEWRNGRRSGFKILSNDLPRVYLDYINTSKPINKGLFYRFIIKNCVATINSTTLRISGKVTIEGSIHIW